MKKSAKQTKQPIKKGQQGKVLLIVILVILAGAIAYFILNAPDRRDVSDKIGDAIHELPEGTDKAARQLKDRTPGEKLEDSTKDVGNDIKKSTNQQ